MSDHREHLPADCTLAIKYFPRSSQPQPLLSTTEFRLKRGAKVRVTLRDVTAHERLGFRRWRDATEGRKGESWRKSIRIGKSCNTRRGRQRGNGKEGRGSYPLSGDLVGPASGSRHRARRGQTDRETDAHMALRSDEDGKKMLEVFAADKVGKVCK